MSQVLKALQKSQQEYEQVQKISTPNSTQVLTENSSVSSWLLVGAVGILLGASVKFYFPQLVKPVDSFTYSMVNTLLSQPPSAEPLEVSSLPLTFLESKPQDLAPLPQITPETSVITSQFTQANESPMTQKRPNSEWDLSKLDLSGLSPELADQVSNILQETPEQKQQQQESALKELEAHTEEYRGKLPPFNLQTHMYASNPSSRWVKVDGEELQEGSTMENGMTLIEIAPRYIVIEFQGEELKVPALYEWAG